MENRLLNQFNSVISSQWNFKEVKMPYTPLNPREVFELAYHTCNSLTNRTVSIKLSPSEESSGSLAIMYSNTKKFITIETSDDGIILKKYYPQDSTGDKLINETQPKLKKRVESFSAKDKDLKTQILKTILVERKLDECTNFVMLKGQNRKIYFAIGDARESAAVVPLFMEAEGASLVQLALNKWMTRVQLLDQEKNFPEDLISGLVKNLMQIKKWILSLITNQLDK
ncbi:MAG: hypothetical protein EU532_09935 [Promethearchaeota archaeon]|nr:MAG: hypothetical protein EU532_09935 [Candidatus Lokiarchaeota archaeon]